MKLLTEMFPHQREAAEKLSRLKVGALYMEMGTGKTRVALELIKRRLDAGKIDRVLWLCPCSAKENLVNDIIKHTGSDGSELIKICGIESLSQSQRLYEEVYRFLQGRKTFLIVDESNLVKNPFAIRSCRIVYAASICTYRLILNGTPISKNEADLFNQWYLLDWRILGYSSYYSFAANHLEFDEKFTHRVRRVLHVDYLTDKIAPYTYEIKKEDCREEGLILPEKIYSRTWFTLTPAQNSHYETVRDAFLELLLEDEDRIGSAAVYRTFTALQQVTSGRRITSSAEDPIVHEPFFASPEENPRIRCLLDAIEDMPGKIIIWTKFRHEAGDVIDILTQRYGEGSAVRFDASVDRRTRAENIEAFRDSARFFVANKQCAGYALNLQFCSNVIYYDNDWDWATRAQSEDRVHRIGQESDVNICDICADRKIDERILECLLKKERLVDSFRAAVKQKNYRQWLEGSDDDTNRAESGGKARRYKRVYRGA